MCTSEMYRSMHDSLKKWKKMVNKYDPIILFLQVYNHDNGFEKKELTGKTRKADKEEWLIQLGKMIKKNL